MRGSALLGIFAALLACGPATARQIDLRMGSVVQTVAKLQPGEYVWAPEAAPSGPILLVVNLATQRAILFRNGVPIAATTISTGRSGYSTPTGVFTILQKHVEHYSTTYDNAPMPYMQRLTWRGIALHAGTLPGYPASHGCIRLPLDFAKLLYGVTKIGMTVVITDHAIVPRVAPTPELVLNRTHDPDAANSIFEWNPARSPAGPVSIVVSIADERATVLRNGIVIGSGRVTVEGPAQGTWAYALRSIETTGQQWIRLDLSADAGSSQKVPPEEWQRFRAPEPFRHAVASVIVPGTTIVVTSDSLRPGVPPETLLESVE